jgi:hypothetical protein
MKRLPKLSLAAALCIVVLFCSSALAAKPILTDGQVQVAHVSWFHKLGNYFHNLFIDLFGGGVITQPPSQPADDSGGPLLDDGSGITNRQPIGTITRDDGWSELAR